MARANERKLEGVPASELDPLVRAMFPHGILRAWTTGAPENGTVSYAEEIAYSLANVAG
jgi:hypothetical protein